MGPRSCAGMCGDTAATVCRQALVCECACDAIILWYENGGAPGRRSCEAEKRGCVPAAGVAQLQIALQLQMRFSKSLAKGHGRRSGVTGHTRARTGQPLTHETFAVKTAV